LVGERCGGPEPERLKRVGMDGPKMSVSRMPVRRPRRAKARERFAGRGVRNRAGGGGLGGLGRKMGGRTSYGALADAAFG
jgi:hypothetical protein